MRRVFSLSLTIFAATTGAMLMNQPIRADDAAALVDNPKYTVWSKYKVGSSETLECDREVGQMKIHLTMTRTLKELTDDSAKVETTTTMDMSGNTRTMPATTETFKAKDKKQDITEKGTEEVEAAGKTYKCKVFEGAMNAMPARGARATAAGHAPAASQPAATAYVSDDVPGGLVKIKTTTPAGEVTLVLTKSESK